jgi:hypothetical protein
VKNKKSFMNKWPLFLLAGLLHLSLHVGMLTRLHGQMVYSLRFTGKDLVNYEGLLYSFPDNRTFMRVKYVLNGATHMVKTEYEIREVILFGQVYKQYAGYNSRFISASNLEYYPDHLFFQEGSATPIVSDQISDPQSGVMATEFILVGPQDMEWYLEQFFSPNDPELMLLKQVANKPQPYTLHLIIAANTLDKDIGVSCQRDIASLQEEFDAISGQLGCEIKLYLLQDQALTKNNLLNMLNWQFSPAANDVAMFLYSGHGFRWNNQPLNEWWPMLDLRQDLLLLPADSTSISLEEIRQAIERKSPRLSIVLADCCNNLIGKNELGSFDFFGAPNRNQYAHWSLERLFFRSSGSLMACSASPGEFAYCNPRNGGFFTQSLLEAIQSELLSPSQFNPNPWESILASASQKTLHKTSSTACSNCKQQTAKFNSSVRSQ